MAAGDGYPSHGPIPISSSEKVYLTMSLVLLYYFKEPEYIKFLALQYLYENAHVIY